MREALAMLPLVVLLAAPALRGQVSWERVSSVTNRNSHAMVPDVAGGGVLLFGGSDGGFLGDTWRFDGSSWKLLEPSAAPTPRHSFAMAADLARQRIVLFGGNSWGARDDTWEWDGTTWTQLQPAFAPSARLGHAGAYDAARQRFVVFGGMDLNGQVLADTWEWDGSAWLLRAPATAPPARIWHSMAYDPGRGRVVVFGGWASFSAAAPFGDTWEWDGAQWLQVAPPAAPPARGGAGMTYDLQRNRVVLFGGGGAGGAFGDTWEWDGSIWQMQASSASPAARWGPSMAFDLVRQRVVLFGGGAPFALSDTWERSGSVWIERHGSSPARRMNTPIAFDPVGRTLLMFSGWTNDTWTWAPSAGWRQLQPQTSPPARTSHAMAPDSLRQRLLLFGGKDPFGTGLPIYFNDTWSWDGTTWLMLAPVVSPPGRVWHAMVEDTARGRVVLYGGGTSTSAFSDTWEWDGAQWLQRTSAVTPGPRRFHALAYDASRARTVLFGGASGAGVTLADTWEWDGTNWSMAAPATVPPQRSDHAMTYDAARRRVVMFGGNPGGGVIVTGPYDDTWEWDGVDWSLRIPSALPGPRYSHALAYDPHSERVLVFGGASYGVGGPGRGTFLYGPVYAATVTTFGSGCSGSAGVPALVLRDDGRPWLGDKLQLALTNLPASAPAAALIGSSDQSWAGLALPFDLGPLGMPGCRLLVSIDLFLPLTTSSGTADLDLPIPNAPVLLGVAFHVQGMAVDPPASAFGVTVSNGCHAVIGGR